MDWKKFVSNTLAAVLSQNRVPTSFILRQATFSILLGCSDPDFCLPYCLANVKWFPGCLANGSYFIPKKQECLRNSSGVQCLGLQNTCGMFHTIPSRSLLKMFFSSSYITYHTWLSTSYSQKSLKLLFVLQTFPYCVSGSISLSQTMLQKTLFLLSLPSPWLS